jgi:hypothetical protein
MLVILFLLLIESNNGAPVSEPDLPRTSYGVDIKI